ncbi:MULTISPECIES: efflux RND transporter periplasmic adaptor subunit [Vibrio]|uniref:Efflux RND transporter periplasmic adaptor subunit n=2 Tax=Vibrio TaxID=662 RepID=A0A7X4LPH6_9VIBR|nr:MULTISPECIES: efflux RND transporter periplasmic adaptor subunit [Vibrio]MBF9001103.1 efflux RND transporter periplasmic adaptor subunit [Vibrio nitrifigilis]MZI95221.1 efflux RND transporter periplasmic adaptor subunit [Vibrio eleionomae]
MTKVLPRYRNSMIAIGLALALTGCQKEASDNVTNQQPQAVAVDTVVLHSQPIEITDQLPGRTSAYRVAEVRPQVEGIIIKRLFVEGSNVEKGDVLYQIDPATYEANLESAKADLASAQATLVKSKLQADRYAGLVKNRAISEQDYEDAMATYRAAQASVLAAKAAVKTAQINLDYTKIKAPISGRIGKSTVTEGALVTANQSDYLATIRQLDPLYVDISQPSSTVLKLRQRAKAQGGDDAKNPKLTGITLTLDDGSKVDQKATLQFADVSVNESTGTVNLRALLPNPDDTLLPGLYVRATVPVDYKAKAFLVPQAAVSRDTQGRAHVNIVNSNNKVEDRVVEADRVMGQNWLVTSGLKDGDQVVVTGLQKIQTGSLVAPKEVDKK